MAEPSLIPDDLLRQIIGVGQVDLLIGLTTYQHATTAGDVAAAVRACWRTHFPRLRTALLNVDGGSSDGTPLVVQHAWDDGTRTAGVPSGLRTTHCITSVVPEITDPGRGTRVLLAAGDLLQAGTIVVLDADALLAPGGIAALAAGVRDHGADLVAPVYTRPAGDGLLVTQLVRPLVRAAFARRLQEPLLPEFACSGRLAAQCTQAAWTANAAERGTHFWIAAQALSGAFALHQCALGPRNVVAGRARQSLQELFGLVVGSVFAGLDAHSDAWLGRSGSEPIAGSTAGPDEGPQAEPPSDGSRLLQSFAQDVANLTEILRTILGPDTLAGLLAASAEPGSAEFPDPLWAATLADFLTAYHRAVMRRTHIAQALLPLYMARSGAFLLAHRGSTAGAVEEADETLGACLEELKPRIVERWAQPA
ncbi:MAG: hypothetical protein R2708_11720 [Vicinamibacterales bacterium]